MLITKYLFGTSVSAILSIYHLSQKDHLLENVTECDTHRCSFSVLMLCSLKERVTGIVCLKIQMLLLRK